MVAVKSWFMLSVASPIVTVASLLRLNRQDTKRAATAELQQWESEGGNPAPNEGGNPASATNAPDSVVTTGCA